jgi:hypothetical protein
MKTRLKTSKTVAPFTTKAFGYEITVPQGWPVSNQTACGPDDQYRFAGNARRLAEMVTGLPDSILRHDLTHYGLNIPAEFCEPYKA